MTMNEFKSELKRHSILIDLYLNAGIEGLISSEDSMKIVEYHSAMMTKLMFDEFGHDIMAKIVSYLNDKGVLDDIKKSTD